MGMDFSKKKSIRRKRNIFATARNRACFFLKKQLQ